MMLLCLPMSLGWLFIALAPSVNYLYIGRLFTGLSGAFSMLAPAFVGEVAEVEIRGGLSSVMQVMTMLGLLFTYSVGAFLSWRTLAWLCLCVPLLAIPCLALLPHAPAYLLSRGREDEARKALQFYRGPNTELVQAEMERLRGVLTQEEGSTTNNLGLSAILSSSQYRKPLALSILLMIMQQFSGIKVISSYIVQIFHNAGSEFDANICSIVVGVIQVTGTSVAVLVVDRVGRRKLLILSEFFIAVSFCMLGTFFQLQEQGSFSPAWLPLASLVLFAVAYSLGMGPLPWVLNSELFAREAKSTSSSLGAASNWLCSFLVVKFAPSLEAAVGTGPTYLSFAVLAAAGTFLIVIAVPETKGRTEEEVAALWGKSNKQRGEREAAGKSDEGVALVARNKSLCSDPHSCA